MGYHVEVNTLVRIPNDFNESTLQAGKTYTVINERERLTPLHIALLMINKDWNFLGYCVVHSTEIINTKTKIVFEVISLFNPLAFLQSPKTLLARKPPSLFFLIF